jgi:hypothetical protein
VRDLSQRAQWALGIIICAAVLTVVVLNLRTAIHDMDYFRTHSPTIPRGPVPIESVVVSCLLIVGEAAILWRLLTATWATIVVRALVAFGLSSAAAFFALLMMHMHDPGHTFSTSCGWVVPQSSH